MNNSQLIRRTIDLLEDVNFPHTVQWRADRTGQGIVAVMDGSGMYGSVEIAGVPVHIYVLEVDIALGLLTRQTGAARLIFQLHPQLEHNPQVDERYIKRIPLDKRAVDRVVNGILMKYRVGVDIGLKINPQLGMVTRETSDDTLWALELTLRDAAKKLHQMYKKTVKNEQ